MIDQLTTDSSLGFHRRGARVTQACCRLLYRPLCCRCLASEGVPQRVLMARAGERDDRDAYEGLIASMSHARRSPLVSRCRLICRSCCAHRAFERQRGAVTCLKVALDVKELSSLSIASTTAAAANTIAAATAATAAATVAIIDATAS